MKALSIQQPYAYAIAMGFKPVENRTWRTKFRGPVLIHASLKEDKDAVPDVLRQIAAQSGDDYAAVEKAYRERRALGAVVGAATIVDCVADHPSPWFFGPWGFVLADAAAFDPVPCKGRLGLFVPPAEALERLHARICTEECACYDPQTGLTP